MIPLVVVLGLIGLLVGGCTYLLVSSTRPAIDATNAYVAAIDDGDYQEAYESMCFRMQTEMSFDQWVERLEAQLRGGEITGYAYRSVSVTNNSFAVVSGTIDVDGAGFSSVIELTNDADQWRVCSRSPLG